MKVLNLLTQAWATSVWVETRSMYCDTVASSQVLGASSQVTVDCFKKLSGKDWSWSQRVGDFYVGWLLRTQNSSQENCSSVVTVDLFLQKQEQVTLYLGDNGFSYSCLSQSLTQEDAVTMHVWPLQLWTTRGGVLSFRCFLPLPQGSLCRWDDSSQSPHCYRTINFPAGSNP